MYIVLLLVAIGLAVMFFFVFKSVRGQTEQTDAHLLEVYQEHQLEQQVERQQSIEEVNAEYEKDLETVAKYLPGIVCWGDTLTVGSENGTSYPSTLQSLINEHICDIYDFHSTIDNADDMNRIDWNDYTIDIPVVNMGGGGEDCNTILGRNGAEPFRVKESFTIPADSEPVEIKIIGNSGASVKPLLQNDAGVNQVTICGVTGTLTLYNYGSLKYQFTRSTPGEPVEVEKGEEITTAASQLYKDYVSVIFIGTYGGFNSVNDLIDKVNEIRNNRTSNKDRYIVIGIYSQQSDYYLSYSTLETRMQSEFGDHYINLRKYLLTDAMEDAGIEPTSQDESRIKVGNIPQSILASNSSIELCSSGYRLLGGLIYDRMESLGYFDEVVDELGLKETRKELESNGKYTPRDQYTAIN